MPRREGLGDTVERDGDPVLPPGLQWLVQLTPLYQGVALERGLMLGEVGWSLLGNAAYLVVLGVVGIVGASRRIERLLLT